MLYEKWYFHGHHKNCNYLYRGRGRSSFPQILWIFGYSLVLELVISLYPLHLLRPPSHRHHHHNLHASMLASVGSWTHDSSRTRPSTCSHLRRFRVRLRISCTWVRTRSPCLSEIENLFDDCGQSISISIEVRGSYLYDPLNRGHLQCG